MYRYFILKRDDSQVTSLQFGNCCPKSMSVALLRLGPVRRLDDAHAPFLLQVRALAQYLVFEVIREMKFGHGEQLYIFIGLFCEMR